MPLFKTKNKFSYTLLISLKSSSIDLQLIKTDSNNKREVIFLKKNVIFLEDSQDPKLYTNQYTKELTNIFESTQLELKQLSSDGPLHIDFILHAPWFTSNIETLFYKEVITLNNAFIKNELKNTSTNTNLKTLEKQVLKIQTNGYSVTQINNLTCSDVQIDVYSSYISKEIHSLLLDISKKYFPEIKTPRFATSPLVTLENIKQYMINEDNILFLNIGAEITEVGIIIDDALSNFSTFPLGVHDFLRVIQTSVKTYDYDLLYQKEILIKSTADQQKFENLKKMWIDSLVQSLEYSKQHIPHKIIIICDSKVKSFFTTLLADSINTDANSILKNHRIINFDISLLKDIIAYKTPVGENELDLTLEALI